MSLEKNETAVFYGSDLVNEHGVRLEFVHASMEDTP